MHQVGSFVLRRYFDPEGRQHTQDVIGTEQAYDRQGNLTANSVPTDKLNPNRVGPTQLPRNESDTMISVVFGHEKSMAYAIS